MGLIFMVWSKRSLGLCAAYDTTYNLSKIMIQKKWPFNYGTFDHDFFQILYLLVVFAIYF